MTRSQQASLNRVVEYDSVTTRSQLEAGIEQVFTGNWSTARLKECQAWQRLTDDQKLRISHLVDRWLYEANGGQGTDSPAAIKAFYQTNHGTSTPIMPSKFVI